VPLVRIAARKGRNVGTIDGTFECVGFILGTDGQEIERRGETLGTTDESTDRIDVNFGAVDAINFERKTEFIRGV